jgi:glutamate racemase
MADSNHSSHGAYHSDMDGPSHEAAYDGFVKFTALGTVVVACWVLALAVGGIKAAWMSAIVGVILAGVAGAIGAFVPSLNWRAPAAVGVLLLLMLIFY